MSAGQSVNDYIHISHMYVNITVTVFQLSVAEPNRHMQLLIVILFVIYFMCLMYNKVQEISDWKQ